MQRFIDSIEKSVEDENWYSALYLALTLPDICARLESENGKTSGAKYIAWYDKYMLDKYSHHIGRNRELTVFLSGADCYALRCSALHEGGADITTQRCREVLEKFHFTYVGSHCNKFNNILQLDIAQFCRDVCNSVQDWNVNFEDEHKDKLHRLDDLLKVYVGPHSMGNGVAFS
ncbi:hypothetical protein QMT33_002795 [Vibrio alginolyticus]|uniref:hypothetical protein n=1 Tax=Vibrio harveyi TaxID=669 RepID=UPI00111BD1B9|nr:hypothetical protein [Vibrio harveyi]ELB2923219.1 hypothetical protein [Vibrio alginolyticus]